MRITRLDELEIHHPSTSDPRGPARQAWGPVDHQVGVSVSKHEGEEQTFNEHMKEDVEPCPLIMKQPARDAAHRSGGILVFFT